MIKFQGPRTQSRWMTMNQMMRRIFSLLLLCLAFSCAVLVAAPPPVPRKAPSFAIQTAPQEYLWLNQYAGRTVILAFILTDCSHCQYTTGLLNAIQKDYADKGVQVIESAIDSMSALHIPDFIAKFKPAFPVGYDEQSYAATFLGYAANDPMFAPQIVFIDRDGMIQQQFGGDDPRLLKEVQNKTLRDALDQTLKAGQGAATKKQPTATRPSAPKQ
jgi:peroxiredoxin